MPPADLPETGLHRIKESVMRKKRLRSLLCAIGAAIALTAAAAMAAGGAGSQSDPLVTLSYLTDTFTKQMMDKVDAQIAQRNAQLGQAPGVSAGTASAYAAVALEPGQALYGEAGCEVLLRSGSASCGAAPSPGLVDATAGSFIDGGAALQLNHLYLMTDARTVASAAGAVLLVRGGYTVG